MKIKDLRDQTREELLLRRREIRKEQFHFRMQQQSGQLEKSSQVRSLRRDAARIETLLSQRRIAAAAATPATTTV